MPHRLRPIQTGTVRACLVMLLALVLASRATAMPISIGTLTYDEFIPGATTAFNITDLTGVFALAPDFPVSTEVTFHGALLHLVEEGGAESDVPLGDVSPGPLLDSGNPLFALQFPSGVGFVSAQFTATLAVSSFLLVGGDTFLPSASSIVANLVPSSGHLLAPGDVAPIDVEGERVPGPTVPEPAAAMLLIVASAAVFMRRRARSRASARPRAPGLRRSSRAVHATARSRLRLSIT